MIWASSGNEISYVIANGKVLVDKYKFKLVDKEKILKDIQQLADKFEVFKNKTKPLKASGAHGKTE